jgi:hypothetical protein
MNEMGAQILPTSALSLSTGKLVMAATVITGIPMAPKATGAVLASRQILEAYSAEKPRPVIMAAATATGVPKPAPPSRKAPNANATSRICSRLSTVIVAMDALMISNLPGDMP